MIEDGGGEGNDGEATEGRGDDEGTPPPSSERYVRL